MSDRVCPCCGRPFDAEFTPDMLLDLPVTGMQKRILDALVDAWPRGLGNHALIDAMYWDDPEGGPLEAERVLKVHLFRLREKIEPMGWSTFKRQGRAPLPVTLIRVESGAVN